MCGIFCCLCEDNDECKISAEKIKQSVTPLLKRRGPDCFGSASRNVFSRNPQKAYHLTLAGSVLHLRGSLTRQPYETEGGNVLVWNGEIFGGVEIPNKSNDTSVLSQLLDFHGETDPVSHVVDVMSRIRGPWSFIYWQASQERLWFGRDFFGRRSLLWHLPSSPGDPLVICSVAQRSHQNDQLAMVELPADGIYCLEISPENEVENGPFKVTRFPWGSYSQNTHVLASPISKFNSTIPSKEDLEGEMLPDITLDLCCEYSSQRLKSTEELLCKMTKSSYNDTKPENTVRPCSQCNHLGFSQDPDEASHCSGECCQSLFDDMSRNVSQNHVKETQADKTSDGQDCRRNSWIHLAEALIKVLGEAVRKRVFNLPRCQDEQTLAALDLHKRHGSEDGWVKTDIRGDNHGKEETLTSINGKFSRVGILFSGGIDSMMLAALADRFVPYYESIDLINVAFEQKPVQTNPTNKRLARQSQREISSAHQAQRFDVPDRITGKSGLLELATIAPTRKWNFLEVNVTLEELQYSRKEYISHLVSPLSSVLDDSIGSALWFAARGGGVLHCPSCIRDSSSDTECDHPSGYTSNAKVLLVGMGADEQLGGYARHRTKFMQHGWAGLIEEIEMEVNRIATRNLGRDDRCISDHGREARFPFLDESVVSFLNALPVWWKTDPRQPRGTGEKLLLRQAARLLGLTSSAALPKRAIQFGSRIAKLESANEKGSDACSRFDT
ncbi:asparagine synthetase domain-containing protein 1 isoform X1 [Nematostella vectensis]|uniref:asparagine synthetase domain-containing protein 1 isoform X1 n=1 Tax=Nematostella vectensis TaxID=45351 RepID=UPI0013901F0A|nr:asparagine synthetase domain-containing protein 1 isoform X1 [Nematostella vectensis]